MPYTVRKKNGRYCVVNKQTGATVHCHDTRTQAVNQIAAIMSSEEGKSMDDTLIYFGDPVKALDENGRVGGYLVRFSDNGKKKDLTGEWFTSKTYLGPKDGDGAEAIFDHGFPIMPKLAKGLDKDTLKAIEAFADRTFAPLKTKRDPVGIWAETVLNLSDDYEKMVFGLVKKEKLGWSSGAAGHRVVKSKEGEIVRWPIAEGSLTPRPAEPQNKAVSLKSLLMDESEEDEPAQPKPSGSLAKALNQRIDDMVEDGRTKEDLIKKISKEAFLDPGLVVKVLANEYRPSTAELKGIARALDLEVEQLKNLNAGGKSIKDIFEEAMAEHEPSRWMLDCTWADLMTKLVMAAAASKLTGVEFDLEGKIDEATDGYAERLKDLAKSQAQEYLDMGSDEQFYVRALADPSTDDFVSAKHVDIEDHIALVVSALRSIATRFRANHEARIKAGRQLSEKNRNRLSKLMEQGMSWMSELQTLLDETQPMASDMEKRLAQTEYLRQQWRLHKLGANTDANVSASTG